MFTANMILPCLLTDSIKRSPRRTTLLPLPLQRATRLLEPNELLDRIRSTLLSAILASTAVSLAPTPLEPSVSPRAGRKEASELKIPENPLPICTVDLSKRINPTRGTRTEIGRVDVEEMEVQERLPPIRFRNERPGEVVM